MDKMVIKIGYNEYVVDAQDAFSVATILARGEKYQSRGYGKSSTHYVWSDPTEQQITLFPLSPELYRMAQLAGNPENSND
jgi:hypothetical protein